MTTFLCEYLGQDDCAISLGIISRCGLGEQQQLHSSSWPRVHQPSIVESRLLPLSRDLLKQKTRFLVQANDWSIRSLTCQACFCLPYSTVDLRTFQRDWWVYCPTKIIKGSNWLTSNEDQIFFLVVSVWELSSSDDLLFCLDIFWE